VQWRYLPHDFPDWQSVYSSFRQWKKDGTLKLIHDVLRGKVRLSGDDPANAGPPCLIALAQHPLSQREAFIPRIFPAGPAGVRRAGSAAGVPASPTLAKVFR
jgi:hypothetical protein